MVVQTYLIIHIEESTKYRIVVNVVMEEMETFWNSMC